MLKRLLFLLLCYSVAWGQGATDLFISEYVEGSSYNKYIEIFNGTGSTVDLSSYQLQLFSNGSGTPKTFNLSGTLENNQVIVYKHSSAAVYSGAATGNSTVINFNGDDAVALVKDGNYVDIFGCIGQDPGSYWSVSGNKTQNKTLVRNPDVTAGVTSNETGFPTLGTEWTMLDEDTHSLGTHQFDGGSSGADLFISEYVEGSGYNKYIEIFNGTGSAVDLSSYQLQLFSNGSTVPKTMNLSGTLENNQVVVYKHSSAAVYSGQATGNSTVINFNGDDAVALVKNGEYVDIFGTIGEDPGSYWSVSGNKTQNKTLVRNPDVTAGVTVNEAGFPTLGTEWTMKDEDTHSLGTHQLDNGNPGEADLFISEYVEGSGYNKYIEIFNGTGSAVDLSSYQLQLFSNGSTVPQTFTLSGTLENNQVVVYQHSSAVIYSGQTTSNSTVINFNGDDAVALVKNGSYVDIFGTIGEDPGSYWSVSGNITQNKTLVRNPDVTAGVTSNEAGFPTLGTEWTMMDEDTHSLGTHQTSTGAADLFISEYVEGSSYNKYIELFNGTGNAVDLSEYELQLFSNGSTFPQTLTLSGILENNQVAVYKHSSAVIYSGAATSSSTVINFNGDDAVALVKNGEYVDIFGTIGEDPGSYWSVSGNLTQNKTLVRNSNVSAGVTANSAGFPTLGTEWTMMNEDTHNLGTHQFDGGSSVSAPVAAAASSISLNGFTANWSAVSGALNYFLDVSASSSFSSFVTGFENKNTGTLVSSDVTGLTQGTLYYYRVRVQTSEGTSGNSNVISVQTAGTQPTTVSFVKRNALVKESAAQSTFEVKIVNPSSTAVTASIVLTKGNAAELSNYQTQTITFPAGSAASQYLTFTTTNDNAHEALEYFSFELQNVSGGNAASVSGYGQLDITVVDDDWKNNSMYNTANGLSGSQLKAELNNLVDGHTEYPYTASTTDTWDILKVSDQDPNDTTKVHLIYTGFKVEKDGHSSNLWNREHVWAKSHGDFGTALGAGTDLHHLRPANPGVNSSRSNKDFDNGGTPHSIATECKSDADSWEPRDDMKGDVARMIFYMSLRYEGENGEVDLELFEGVNSAPNKEPLHGNLSALLQWNTQDPPDAFEMRRNEIIYGYQGNRNPFIDNPDYIGLIWSSGAIQKASENDIIEESFLEQNHPNPFNPSTKISFGVKKEGKVKIEIFNVLGERVKTLTNKHFTAGTHTVDFDANDLPSGIYFCVMQTDGFVKTTKMVLAK